MARAQLLVLMPLGHGVLCCVMMSHAALCCAALRCAVRREMKEAYLQVCRDEAADPTSADKSYMEGERVQ